MTEAITLETGAHVVHFHQDDADLLSTVGGYVVAAIRAGDATLVIATSDHREAVAAHLAAAGIDVAEARRTETFVTIDAAAVLARFYADGRIDAEEFRSVIGDIISGVNSRTGRTVRCHGEMVALLWDAGAVTAALELEGLWNDLNRELGFSLLCTYSIRSVAGAEHSDARRAVYQLHSDVIGARRGAQRHFRPRQPGTARSLGAFSALSALTRLNLAPRIHQASGMVSVQLGVDTVQALDRLRSFATDHDKTLDDVAEEVISRQLRFKDPGPR